MGATEMNAAGIRPIEMVRSLHTQLPEDILRKKLAGDLDGAAAAIGELLRRELPRTLRARLLCEQERLRRLPLQYPWNRAQAMEKLRGLVPDITEAELDELERGGWVDFIYIGGEKRYFLRFHTSMMRLPDFARRAGKPLTPASPWLDPMIEKIRARGRLALHIRLETAIRAAETAFEPGEYRAWLPVALGAAQQRDVRVETDADAVDPADAPARTAYFERRMERPEDTFRAVSDYVSEILYADPLHAPAPAAQLYPAAPPPAAEDLGEDGTFITFTPYLRALAAELTEGAEDDLHRAWRIYEFITTKVKYSFVRQYFQIDSIGEYCALNLKGDCGLQALLFISLCRICGIPARWQSGLSISADDPGSHDWAQFYLPGWGWLFADPSFGGGAWRSGARARWLFYFGNLDPARMAAASCFMAEFSHPAAGLRVDPFANQTGEIERIGRPLPFVGRELDETERVLLLEELP